MINFLRKKRKQLADDNKVLKYLRYAFGEIILVVLGILIALQINNWNKNRMDHALEKNYLIRLQNELIQDTSFLDNQFDATNYGIKNIKQAILKSYVVQNNKEEIESLLSLHNFYAEALVINKATYDDLVNTQNLNIIRNEDLRFLIIDFYRSAAQASKAIDNFNQLAWDMQVEFMVAIPMAKYYPWNSPLFSEEQLNYKEDFDFIKDPTSYKFGMMESMQLLFLNKHEHLLHFYKDLKMEATEIIHLIDQELE